MGSRREEIRLLGEALKDERRMYPPEMRMGWKGVLLALRCIFFGHNFDSYVVALGEEDIVCSRCGYSIHFKF